MVVVVAVVTVFVATVVLVVRMLRSKHRYQCIACGTTKDLVPIPPRSPRDWYDRYPPEGSVWVCPDPAHMAEALRRLRGES